MRHLSMGARRCARQGSAAPSIQSFHALRYLVIVPSLAALFVVSTSHAALTFDLRAVSGSQVTIHSPKSVGVTQSSVGGWIDFELWALVSGGNANANDDGMQNFIGNMLSTHTGLGAAVGNMINTGEVAPRARRGVIAPFDGPAYQDGTVQNLDGDFELEIGGTDYGIGDVTGMIAARAGPDNTAYYEGDGQLASLPLYRFTLPIESVPAESLADMTRVHFDTSGILGGFIWFEDSVSYSPRFEGAKRPGTMLVNEGVLIHTAQTPEELAAIPEPGTWLLGLLAIVGLMLARNRRAVRLIAMNRSFFIVLFLVACLAFFTSQRANAALTFDLRAVSGSRIAINNPKSVAVSQNSVGGWIDFELYAFVNGWNNHADDESIHSFVGNMLSTHIGHGAAGGSMVNTGEVASRVRRGIVPPLDHAGTSDGWLQNLDGDSDLEIGGTGWAPDIFGDLQRSSNGMIAGRGDPFRVQNYEGQAAVAEFLLYRFSLPIESFLAENPTDMTAVSFTNGPLAPFGMWFEDGESRSNRHDRSDRLDFGQSVLIRAAQTPEELALIPEPSTWGARTRRIDRNQLACETPTRLVRCGGPLLAKLAAIARTPLRRGTRRTANV